MMAAGGDAGGERPGGVTTLLLAALLVAGTVVASMSRGSSGAAAPVHGRTAVGTLNSPWRRRPGEVPQAAGGGSEPPKSTAPPAPTTYLNNDKAIRGPITPSKFHVVQFGNAGGVAMYTQRCHIPCVLEYVRKHQYNYHQILTTRMNRRGKYDLLYRVEGLRYLLSRGDIKEGDWLIHMDMDACVADRERSLEDLVELAEKSNQGRSCDFLGQDSPNSINGGFLMIKASPDAKWIINEWYDIAIQAYTKSGLIWNDQHMLQAAVVRYATEHAGLTFKPEVHIKGDKWCRQSALNNSDKSFTFKHDHSLPCYRQYMARLNLVVNERFFGHVCLWKSTDRVNMHEYRWVRPPNDPNMGKDYQTGDFLAHTDPGKKRKLSNSIFKC